MFIAHTELGAGDAWCTGLVHSHWVVLYGSPCPVRWAEQADSLYFMTGGSDMSPVPSLSLLRPLSPVPVGGRVLQIPLVRAEDAGRYSCKASNEVGEDWLHYELMVLSEWSAWDCGRGWVLGLQAP